jgi:hypothetical protein
MGILGKHIDEMCEKYPELMEKVLTREFGDLDKWVVLEPETSLKPQKSCGCYIGSIALEVKPELKELNQFVDIYYVADYDVIQAVGDFTRGGFENIKNVGMQASCIQIRIENQHEVEMGATNAHSWAQELTVRMIKERIHRNLVKLPVT